MQQSSSKNTVLPAAMINELPVQIIPSTLDALMLDSWVRSNRGSDWVRGVPGDIYGQRMREAITSCCDFANIKRAVWSKSHDQHYGYIVYEAPRDNEMIVHYLWVKKEFRNCGIGRRLLESTGWHTGMRIVATHRTWVMQEYDLANKYAVTFNPYLFTHYIGA